MQARAGSAKLTVLQEGKQEFTVEIVDCLSIGRSSKNDLVLEDEIASRRHAEIRQHGRGRYTLVDVGSANGTWLNGRRLVHPRELANGDIIQIGGVKLQFLAPELEENPEDFDTMDSGTGTCLSLRTETVIVLVTDIRNYTGMSEVLPSRDFSLLIADWFKQSSEIVEASGGTVDKFIGDAVMAYWLARNRADPSPEVNDALSAARSLIRSAEAFTQRFSSQFPGQIFRIGIGINMGEAVLGNLGGGEHQSFTVVGDNVNVAFRLESLTKERGYPVVVSRKVTEYASGEFEFQDLGNAEVKGRTEPVSIWSLTV
jgi:adenylate cyclase